jgi:RHS repeat-associated protein
VGDVSAVTVVETLDYYPYGAIRLDNATGTTKEVRKYIGQEYDQATSLSYLQSRYYNGAQGQFLSQDPVFLGDPNSQILYDPQSLNSYSYSEDNPITKSDPNGRDSLVPYITDFGEAGGAILAGVTAPEWLPPVLLGAAAIGTVAYIGDVLYRNRNTDNNLSNFGNPNPGQGFLNQNMQMPPGMGPKIIAGVIGAGVLLYSIEQPYLDEANSSPQMQISVGGSNMNSNNLYWTQPSSSAVSHSTQSTSGKTNSGTTQGGNSGGGLSQQQIQSIQSELNQIQNEINQIQSEINALSSGKK